jgi:antirestriction protein ArdC
MKTANTPNVYEIVTERIVKAIESGNVAPWRKPWNSGLSIGGKRVVGPLNARTGKSYTGINVFLLLSVMAENGYSDPRFVTFKQATEMKGNVKRGEKGHVVVFWKPLEIEEKDEKTGETRKRKTFILRYYTVFNVEQCEKLIMPELVKAEPKLNDTAPIETAERILANIPNKVAGGVFHTSAGRACYSILADRIEMPHVYDFESMSAYYATRFHEEAHATGHPTRLNRRFGTSFGDEAYSEEELIAEMTAAFLCMFAGIDSTLDQSAAYVKGWLSKLRNDSRLVVNAASKAQKAAQFILGDTTEKEDEG